VQVSAAVCKVAVEPSNKLCLSQSRVQRGHSTSSASIGRDSHVTTYSLVMPSDERKLSVVGSACTAVSIARGDSDENGDGAVGSSVGAAGDGMRVVATSVAATGERLARSGISVHCSRCQDGNASPAVPRGRTDTTTLWLPQLSPSMWTTQ
jgi:hypothetical protein